MQENLELNIAHRLPGRIRFRLSHAPNRSDRMIRHIQNHGGVESVLYTDVTRNLLITFDEKEIAYPEVVLRAGLSVARDYEMVPVRIRIQKKQPRFGSLSALALAAIVSNHALMLLSARVKRSVAFQMITGAATLAAVLEHVVEDVRDKGYFHPEVFSVYYLLLSFVRGNVLKGSTITWLLTFGRHLLEVPAGTLLLMPEKTDPNCELHRCEYEITVKNEKDTNRLLKLAHTIPNMLFRLYKETDLSLVLEDAFINKMEEVADTHDDIIEGLGNLERGFYLKVET